MNNLNELFKEIADLNVWSPYQMDGNTEVPLSADEPVTLAQAQAVAAEQGLPGVGIVLTGGIHRSLSGDLKTTLVVFDFIGVDADKFELPLYSYCERSPSGSVRAFGWAPSYWAEKYTDSPMLTPPGYVHCERAAFWFGTSPKFLAVTGDGLAVSSLSGGPPTGVHAYICQNIAPGWRNHLDRFKGFNRAKGRIDERTEKWQKHEYAQRQKWEANCRHKWEEGEAERRAKWNKEQNDLEICSAKLARATLLDLERLE